jgi:tetratricopeptide (TPR) repeat protein
VYSKLKKYDDAIAVYEEILNFEKEKPEIYMYLAETYRYKKDYAKAEEILRKALSLFVNNDELNFNLAIILEKTNRYDEMVQCLKKTIEINPNHADALNYLGYSYADKGINLAEARSLINRALDLKPDNGYILDSLGWVHFKLGEYDEALKTLLKAAEIAKDAPDPVIFEHIGDVYNSKGIKDKAKEYWEKAIGLQEKEEGLKERVEKKIQNLN